MFPIQTDSFDKEEESSIANKPPSLTQIGRQSHLSFMNNQMDKVQSAKAPPQSDDLTSNASVLYQPPTEIRVVSLFKDLPILKKTFGVFSLFTDHGLNDPDEWITQLVAHLESFYSDPNEVIKYFQSFLDKDFQVWFFSLDESKKSSLKDLKREFLHQATTFQREQHKLCDLPKDAFLVKLKKIDSKLVQSIQDEPLVTYFKHKFICYSKALPKHDKTTVTSKIIFQLDDDDLIKKFYPLRSDELATILLFAQFEDKKKS